MDHGEVHHVIAFPGGKTILVNLAFLCDYHHHILHKPGWHATFDGTTFTVTKPDGRRIGSTERVARVERGRRGGGRRG